MPDEQRAQILKEAFLDVPESADRSALGLVDLRGERQNPLPAPGLYHLLQQAATRVNPPPRPHDVLDALFDGRKEFRKLKRRREWPKL